MNIYDLEKAALEIRKNLLRLCSMQSIHIGGDLSLADVMTVLWQYQMVYNPKNPRDENRDRFVLSKGHASAVTSFCQASIGCFKADDIFKEYASDSGRFSMHSCSLKNTFVEVSTGSLGHGMPVACGIAAALKIKGNKRNRVYTVMGDGEQAEGSIWEAAMNAVKYKLGNLVAIIDFNKLQADGTLHEITALGDISSIYKTIGWDVWEFNGNEIEDIIHVFDQLPSADSDRPILLVAHTIKGKGVPLMENQVRWHAGKITEQMYEQSVAILEQQFRSKYGL